MENFVLEIIKAILDLGIIVFAFIVTMRILKKGSGKIIIGGDLKERKFKFSAEWGENGKKVHKNKKKKS